MRFSIQVPATAVLCAALTLLSAVPARAVVDDSHSAAMEAAVDAVKKGFKIRQDYLKGELKSGGQKLVKQQLFKGNEYWFFLGTAAEDVKVKLEVFDSKGAKVAAETVTKADACAVRVVAPKTGTYLVVFSLTGKDGQTIPWALAYGYK